MDTIKTKKYRKFIKQILAGHTTFAPKGYDEFETQLLIDEKNDHYMVVLVGWDDMERTLHIVCHVDLKGEKIWIQEDKTEYSIGSELQDLGVPKSDVVLAFYPPVYREWMVDEGFAVS